MIRRYIQTNSLLQQLRIDELIGLVLMLTSIFFASVSNFYMLDQNLKEVENLPFNVVRILASIVFLIIFYGAIYKRIEVRYFRLIRDFMPFLFVLVIFYNIQDMIFLLNPQDIHQALVGLDGKLFGVQPVVWMEQFYHPRLTDWFAFSYLNYYVMTLLLLALLYQKGEFHNFRTIMVTMMISYYIGFVSYVFFPASSPYLVIPELFEIDIWLDSSFISWITYSLVEMSPHRVRDAFPSMHNAIVLLTMIMAWRYHRKFFWLQLPLALSLPVATVYLRYHFVVDIIGALPVIAAALYLTPHLELKWKQLQNPNIGVR